VADCYGDLRKKKRFSKTLGETSTTETEDDEGSIQKMS
jgi:hypothetical protein